MRRPRRWGRIVGVGLTLLAAASCSRPPHADPIATLGRIRPSSNPAPPGSDGPIFGQDPTAETIADYMTAVFNDLNDYWRSAFARAGITYKAPEPVWVPAGLTTDSNCGRASYPAEAFYCPGGPDAAIHSRDRVYISLEWMQRALFQQPVPHVRFVVSSVLAHMFSHHVQRSIGLITPLGSKLCCQLDTRMLENNANCLAGVWAHATFAKEDVDDTAILQAMRVVDATEDVAKLVPGAVPTATADDSALNFKVGYATGDARRCQGALRAAPAGTTSAVEPVTSH